MKTLEDYLIDSYAPTRQLSASAVLKRHRPAARQFDRFHPDPIGDVGEHTINRFCKWLARRGYSVRTVRDYGAHVKAMLRHWRPQGAWEVAPSFRDGMTPGALDHAFLSRSTNGRPVVDGETRRRYSRTLQLFGQYLGRPALVSDLCRENVTAFLAWLAVELGMARWTVANHSQRLAALWRWAWRARLVEQAPKWCK